MALLDLDSLALSSPSMFGVNSNAHSTSPMRTISRQINSVLPSKVMTSFTMSSCIPWNYTVCKSFYTFSFDSAFSAHSFGTFQFDKIISVEGMPFNAMCFSRIYSRNPIASKNVLSVCDWLKMIRINAMSYFTKMIKIFSSRNRTFHYLVRDSMSQILGSVHKKKAIASFANSASPDPATLRLFNYFAKKSFFHKGSHNIDHYGCIA